MLHGARRLYFAGFVRAVTFLVLPNPFLDACAMVASGGGSRPKGAKAGRNGGVSARFPFSQLFDSGEMSLTR